MMVMDGFMHIATDEVLGAPTEQRFGGRVEECRLTVRVDTVDTLTGRTKDQLVLTLDIAEDAIDPLPLGDPRVVEAVGRCVGRVARLLLQVDHREQDERLAVRPLDAIAAILHLDIAAAGMPGCEAARPVVSEGLHRIAEDDQRGELPGMQSGKPGIKKCSIGSA